MEIYQEHSPRRRGVIFASDVSKGTPSNHSGRKPLSNYNSNNNRYQATPHAKMKGDKKIVKVRTMDTTPRNGTVLSDKENHNSRSPVAVDSFKSPPSSAQALRRTLRGISPKQNDKQIDQNNVAVLQWTEENFSTDADESRKVSFAVNRDKRLLSKRPTLVAKPFAGGALGPPQRVAPKTPNSLLRTELDDSMDELDESLLVSPPGALWNVLGVSHDPSSASSTGILIVPPSTAATIHAITTTQKKQQKQMIWASPPLQPRSLLSTTPDSHISLREKDNVKSKSSTSTRGTRHEDATRHEPQDEVLSTDRHQGRTLKGETSSKRWVISTSHDEVVTTQHQPNDDLLSTNRTIPSTKKGIAIDLSMMFSEDGAQNHMSKVSRKGPPAHLIQRLQKSAPEAREPSKVFKKIKNASSHVVVERIDKTVYPKMDTELSRVHPSASPRLSPHDPYKHSVSTEKLIQKNEATQDVSRVEQALGFEVNSEKQKTDFASKPTDHPEPCFSVKQESFTHKGVGKGKFRTLMNAGTRHSLKKSDEAHGIARKRNALDTSAAVTAPHRSNISEKPSIKSRVSLQKNTSFFASSTTGCAPLKLATDGDEIKDDSHVKWTISKANINVEKSSLKQTNIELQSSATIRREVHDWAGKQCETFVSWLNYTFQPDEEDDVSGQQRTGLRALVIHRRLAQVRFKAAELFRSEDMKRTRDIIQSEIARGRLSIRSDRDIHADLSLRTQATNLLLSYTTPWLRLGLEVMFGESIFPNNLHEQSDMKTTPVSRMRSALKTFVVERVLSDSKILMKYTKGKTKVPSGKFEKLYREEMRTLVLYRLMVLILFLDHAKMENILDVPRLFAKNSEAKSSREVLLVLCRNFLSAEGDFIKHLSRIGLHVAYVQDPIDELDFTVTNLAADLRDGACLTRMTEIVTKTRFKSIMRSLRLPAVSRLQKMHNVNVALSALSNYGVLVPKDVNAHHVVDAHREMVLKLMWSVISQTCITKLLSETQVEHEIEIVLRSGHARRKLEGIRERSRDHPNPDKALCPRESTEDALKSLLLRWCKAVCSNFGLPLIDLTGSFADGKAFCYLLHYYHPAILKLEEILPTSTDEIEDLSEQQALENERANAILASKRVTELGGIPRMLPITDSRNPPDEKSIILCLAYLCSRLMESSEEIFATILIQACYRRYREKILQERKKVAARFIFQFWTGHKHEYYTAQQRRYAAAVAVIETFCCVHKHSLLRMKRSRLDRERRHNSAVHIQRCFRGLQCRKIFNDLLLSALAATVIQKYFRRFKAQLDTLEMLLEKEAVTRIQSHWRSWRQRRNYKAIIPCAVKLQSITRGFLVRTQLQKQQNAANTIQKAWLIWVAYADSQVAAVIIQAHVRGTLARQYYRNLKYKVCAARTIQKVWRGYCQFIAYAITREFAIVIQKTVRRFQVKKTFPLQRMSEAAVMIQKTWRGFWTQVKYNLDVLDVVCIQSMVRRRIAQQTASRRFHAISCLQRSFRCFLSHRKLRTLQLQRELKQKQNSAAVICQCAIRMWKAKKALESRIITMESVVMVQSSWRQFLCKKSFLKSISAAKLIQAKSRGMNARRRWQALTRGVLQMQRRWRLHIFRKRRDASATTIQAQWRCTSRFKKFRHLSRSTVAIQKCWRAFRDFKEFQKTCAAAVSIQAAWRRYSARLNFELDVLEIVIAQSAVRRMIAQRMAQKRRLSLKILQNSGRRYLAGIQLQNLRCQHHDYLRRCSAATIVQSVARRYLATCFRRRAHYAATVISASWRMAIMRHRFHSLKRMTIKVQALYRMHHVCMKHRIRHHQAIKIQSRWRTFLQRKKYFKTHRLIVAAQSVFRRYICKKRTSNVKYAILILQCVARRFLACQHVRKLQIERSIILLRHLAARRIQAAFRGVVIRRYLWWKHSQATLIQAYYRGHISRVSFALDRYDIIIVQSMIRAWLARRLFRSMRASIVMFQAAARVWMANRIALKLRLEKHAQWTRNNACKNVQKMYRGYLVRRNIASLNGSATRIQTCFRRHYHNAIYMMNLVDVIIVQSLARRHLACQRLRKAHSSAVVIQCLARRMRALEVVHLRRSKKIALENRHRACVTIQRNWRGHKSRKRSTKHAAARKIQKTWRCFTAHVEYLVQQISVIRLQAQIRKYRAQLAFKRVKIGIVLFQAVARGFLQREYIRFISMSAIIVQSSYRRYQQRGAFLQAQHAAILIQGVARGYLVRDELILSHFAATEIQRVWRGFTQFCDFFVHIEAVIKIQSFFRKIRSVIHFSNLKIAAQVETRRYNVKARTIQRTVRMYLHRLHLERASQVIQRLARSYIRQRRYTTVERGVKRLQAIVRAVKVRRRRSKKVVAAVVRLDVANRKARNDPKLQIGYKTRHALHVLQTSRSLAEIMDAVKSLEVSTRLSSLCCILFTEANAAMILLDLIRSCNRSVPHVELVQCILLTLDNVAQYRSLVPSFADCNAAEIFLDKMQMFRDKDGIFCLSTSLLGCIAKCNPIVEDFCAMHEHLKRLKALHALSLRRSKSTTSGTTKQDLGTRFNRMRRREYFDRNVAIKSLGSMVANLESRKLVSSSNENGVHQHFTF